jgi:DNA-binding transcriptional ArsR family regulator
MPAAQASNTFSTLFPQLDRERPDSTHGKSPPARQKGRAADWKAQISRAYAYAAGRAASEAEAAELERAFEAALEEGPDFTNCRRDSLFLDAPKVAIDRNLAARIRFQLVAIFRGTWKTKDKGKHAGLVKHSVIEVFDALIRLAFKHGRLFPSLVGLAYLAGRSKQTVVNALKVLAQLGFITIHRRIKRVRTALGIKVVQNTNAYEVHEPGAFGRMAFQAFSGGSESRKLAARKPNCSSIGENPTKPPQKMPWERHCEGLQQTETG